MLHRYFRFHLAYKLQTIYRLYDFFGTFTV